MRFRLRFGSTAVGLVISISALALTLIAASASAQHRLRFDTTVEGEVVFTGNTLGLSHTTSNTNGPGTTDAIGTFIAANPASIDNVPEDEGNPWPSQTTSSWQENGSSAVLDLPFDKDFEVLYAELLWGGSWSYKGEDVSAFLDTSVTLRHEDGASVSVTPDPETSVTLNQSATSGSFRVHYYIRSAAVSDFVRDHGAGTYTVEGVPATQNHADNSLNAAGWTLAVAYAASELQARNMNIWVGAEWVDENDEVDFTLEGFCTPPFGTVTGQALISAIEGDASRPDDQVLIAETSDDTFVALSGDYNPETNFFGSQINDASGARDERGTFGTVNHDPEAETNTKGGRQGWDITGVPLDGRHLGNDQHSATLRATSTGDSYVTTLVALTADVNAPLFDVVDAVSVDRSAAGLGQTLTYTILLDNIGSAPAQNVVFFFPLPEGLTLQSFRLNGDVGDVAGNPVTAADLESGVDLGTIANGGSAGVEIRARVDAIPEPPAEASFGVQARWSYEYISCVGQPAIPTAVTADSETLVQAPRVGLVLGASPAVLTRSSSATLEVAVGNTGTAAASGVTLRAQLPAGLSYWPGSTTLNGNAVADSGGMPFGVARPVSSTGAADGVIEVGQSGRVAFEVDIPEGAPDSTLFEATVDPDGAGPAPPKTASVSLTVTGGDTPFCGDGRIEGSEACDDGNLAPGDGCGADCRIEPGYTCTGEPSDCDPIGQPDAGAEPLDAGRDTQPEPDTGRVDTGLTEPEAEPESGPVVTQEACSCSTKPANRGWLGLMFFVSLVALRRTRGERG